MRLSQQEPCKKLMPKQSGKTGMTSGARVPLGCRWNK
jgi:hypothetical protein